MTVVFGDVPGLLGDTGFNRIKVNYKGMGERGVINKLRG
jgi:hypothetical protein